MTPWTVACQVPQSMKSSRQEYWSGLPCPPPGDLANPGTEPTSLVSLALAGRVFTTALPGKLPQHLLRKYCHLHFPDTGTGTQEGSGAHSTFHCFLACVHKSVLPTANHILF